MNNTKEDLYSVVRITLKILWEGVQEVGNQEVRGLTEFFIVAQEDVC